MNTHTAIEEIFPNIFFVMGENKTHYQGVDLQHSRNMIIIRNDHQLSLINTVKLDDNGLAELEALGKIENVIRLGAFHGRDDAFYLNRYHATLWAINGMEHANHRRADVELTPNGNMPFPHCSFFRFETSKYPEGALYIPEDGGILITCDSVKNWEAPDQFFSKETAELYQKQGFFGSASISSIWKQATNVHASDFERLMTFSFRHLISAHGKPLLNHAYEKLSESIKRAF